MAIKSRGRKNTFTSVGKPIDILQCSPIPTFVIDGECKISHWNRACQLLTGMDPEIMLGTHDHRKVFYVQPRLLLADLIVHGLSHKALSMHYDGGVRPSPLVRDGFEREQFFPYFGQNGMWLFFTAAPLRDDQGNVVGAIETFQDITPLRETEKALYAREVQYHQLFEYANDAILVLKGGFVTHCNPKTLDLFKLLKKQIIGGSLLDLSPEFQPSGESSEMAMGKNMTNVLEENTGVFEWRFHKRDGSPVDTEVSMAHFDADDDRHLVVIVRDVSRRKKMVLMLEKREKELDEQRRYLEKANLALKANLDYREVEKRAVEEHFLMTLKRFILPYIETLNNVGMNSDAKAYVNIIDSNLNEMISRLSSARYTKYIDFTPAEIRIADLICEGKNTKEIAALLGLAPSSIKWHRKNIRRKLGLTNKSANLYSYLNSLGK